MFCRHCGTQLPESARFCPNCCAPTSEIYDMRINVPTIQRGTPLSTQKHSNSHSIGMIVLLLILCSFLMIGVPMAMIGVIGISLYDEYGELTYDLTVNVSADKYNDYSKTVYHPGSGTNYIHHYLPSGKYTVTANKWNALMEVANAFIIIPDNEIT